MRASELRAALLAMKNASEQVLDSDDRITGFEVRDGIPCVHLTADLFRQLFAGQEVNREHRPNSARLWVNHLGVHWFCLVGPRPVSKDTIRLVHSPTVLP